MGVADTVSRREFLGFSTAAGASLGLESKVQAFSRFLIPSDFLATLNALSLVQDSREKVPDDKSIKDAEQMIQKLFKDEYKAKKPEFADTLLDAASKEKGASRFVVLRDAAQIASDNFKLSSAFKAVEQLAENYQLKLDGIVKDSLTGSKKGVKSPENAVEFAEFGLQLTDLGIKWNDYEMAVRAATEAKSASTRTAEKSLMERATEKLKEANLLKREYDEFTKAELRLAGIKPEDVANDASKRTEWERLSLVIGKWYCFKENKWDIGIYALRTGSDKDLADIAKKEVDIKEKQDKNAQLTAENFYDIAEAWYGKSQKERDQRDKGRYADRALAWYEKSLASAEGLLKAKVEKRVSELRTAGPSSGNIVDLLKMIDVQKDAVAGKWEMKDGKLISDNTGCARIQIPYQPPEEYDYRVVFKRLEGSDVIQQIASKSGKSFSWAMGLGEVCGFEAIKGRYASGNQTTTKCTIEKDHVYTSIVQIRKGGVKAFLDGKQIAEWKTDYSDMSISPSWKLRDENCIGLGTYSSSTEFQTVTITEISGKGQRPR